MICVQCHADDATTIRREGGSDDRLDLCGACARWFDNLEPRDRGVDDAPAMSDGWAIKNDWRRERLWSQR